MIEDLKYALDSHKVWWSIKHRHGPKHCRPRSGGVCVFALVKNGEDYIDTFVEHYLSLGIDNIAFLDNCSTDGSVDLMIKHPQVSVYQSNLPFLRHEAFMRRVFLQRYRAQHWMIAVDVDEFLTFPGENARTIHDLTRYMDRQGANAATACMVDFLPHAATVSGQPLARQQGRYVTNLDLIKVEAYPTHSWLATGNQPASNTHSFSGGIRAAVTGTHDILLLKHPLMKIDGKLIPFAHPHFCHHATLADVSLALYHYKFAGHYMQRIREVCDGPDAETCWGQENAKYLKYFTKVQAELPEGALTDANCDASVLCASGLMQGGEFWPTGRR
jgi:Glycosyl transferase family 2